MANLVVTFANAQVTTGFPTGGWKVSPKPSLAFGSRLTYQRLAMVSGTLMTMLGKNKNKMQG